MCQLSNTVTNNDMKQGNFGTIYNFKHSIKKKKKDPNKAEFVQYSRAAVKCTSMEYAKPEGAEEGAGWFSGVPGGSGAVVPPRPGSRGGQWPCRLCRAAGRDWAAQALVAVGRCGKLVPSRAAWLHGAFHIRSCPFSAAFPERGTLPPPRGHVPGGVAAARAASVRFCTFQPCVILGPGSSSVCVLLRPVVTGLVAAAGLCGPVLGLGDGVGFPLLLSVSSFTPLKFGFRSCPSPLQGAELRDGRRGRGAWGRWADA